MLFEWDEVKNRVNREKHGLDFSSVFDFDWENALLTDRTRQGEGEQRFAALGICARKVHTVVFTKRGDKNPDQSVGGDPIQRKNELMHRPKATKKLNPDDMPLRAAELATLRPLREVFPDLTEWSRKRKRARKGEAHKEAVSIRLSPEVIEFYKKKGPGWQTRIDATLRAIVAAAK